MRAKPATKEVAVHVPIAFEDATKVEAEIRYRIEYITVEDGEIIDLILDGSHSSTSLSFLPMRLS